MDLARATLDAYDGVEKRFGGRVLRIPAFSVAESAHLIRQVVRLGELHADLSDDGLTLESAGALFGEMHRFSTELVERLSLEDVTLADLGVEEAPDLTVARALALLGAFIDAAFAPDVRVRSDAQIRWMDEGPGAFGTTDLAETSAAGQRLAQAFYLATYGLAVDFSARLHEAPGVETWMLTGPEGKTSTSAAGTPT